MPWIGRLFDLAMAMNTSWRRALAYCIYIVGRCCAWSYGFFSLNAGMVEEHGVNWDLRNIGTGLTMASRSIPSIRRGAHIAFDSLHRYIETPRYPENGSAAGGVCLD